MSPSRHRPIVLGGALAVACVLALSAQGPDLPAGKGEEVARAKCLTCHGADLMRQQRLTRTGWEREVDKMVRWGATVTEPDRGILLEYLAATWPVRAVTPAPPVLESHAGAETFRRRCLMCHGMDIVDQQRLGRGGWEREVDKMVRWGAEVSETEKPPLVDYLVLRAPR